MNKTYWVSNKFSTFLLEINEEGIITTVAPIAWKWKGKYLDEFLEYWKPDKLEELI